MERKQTKKENKNSPQHIDCVLSNRFGPSEHAYVF